MLSYFFIYYLLYLLDCGLNACRIVGRELNNCELSV